MKNEIKFCRLCSVKIKKKRKTYLNLGLSPSQSQNLSKDKKKAKKQIVNLKLYRCDNCNLIQLLNYASNYYRSSIRSPIITQKRKDEIKSIFKFIKKKFIKSKNIIEIGAGRGEYLNLTNKYFKNVLGYEFDSTLIRNKITKNKILKFYPNDKNSNLIKKCDGIYCLNFLEHSINPNKFFQNIVSLLKPSGFLFIEVPNFKHMYDNNIFYDFTLEHLSYFDEKSLSKLFQYNNIEIIYKKFTRNKHNILMLGKKNNKVYDFDHLNKELSKIKIMTNHFLKKIKKNIVIWGACHHTFELLIKTSLKNKVSFLVDSSSNKHGKYAPGTNIKIFNPEKLKVSKTNNILISASSYSDEVLKIVKSKYSFIKNIFILKDNMIKKI